MAWQGSLVVSANDARQTRLTNPTRRLSILNEKVRPPILSSGLGPLSEKRKTRPYIQRRCPAAKIWYAQGEFGDRVVSIAGCHSRPNKHTSVYVRRAEQNIPEHAELRQSSGRATLGIQSQYRRRDFAMILLLRKVPWILGSTWFPSSQ